MRSYLAIVLVSCLTNAHAVECMEHARVNSASDYRVEIKQSSTPLRKINPVFFGFNLEWLQFQLGFWDETSQTVDAVIIDAMQDFSGAVYRYPGGISANHFNWKDGVNENSKRPLKNLESWLPPTRVSFGSEEYLSFIKSVNGVPWYVANLYGEKGQAMPEGEMARRAAELAKHLSQSSSLLLIHRWELGNELDRSNVRWTPERVSSVTLPVAEKIKLQNTQARFVIALQEYPAMKSEGYSAEQYNTALIRATRATVGEYALHIYYDDKPKGITIEKQISAICEAIRHTQSQSAIWITEHGFVPMGAWESSDWKKLWPQTADMKAAINVADFQIAAAHIPNIQGTMIHALHGTGGPWPLLHRNGKGEWNESVVLQALRLLRTHMLPNLLQTTSYSAHRSSYNGGYDMRAAVMANDARTQYAVWAINRSNQSINLKVKIDGTSKKKLSIKQGSLANASLTANNYAGTGQVALKKTQHSQLSGSNGIVQLYLPAHSVNAFFIN
jgi:alpha-L-arabinofuranosidase